MITHTEPTMVQRLNTGVEQHFTIKATAHSFDILSSGLYSNKILAVVRELSTNAYDGHVAAGKADIPIEIKLPNSLDPIFYVKDFGVGLKHEDVLNLYTTYFESTKSDSNEYVGMLGLGSKSPFSYTSNFTVESIYNGTKNIYVCFKDESGLPSITHLSTEDTLECSGLTVMLAVKQNDYNNFRDAAKRALMYFNPVPVVLGYSGFKPYTLRHTISGSNWKIRENDYYAYMTGPQVVQGFISYPIDASMLSEHGLSPTAASLSKVAIDFDVCIGQVDVAASRESLQYKPRTIDNLAAIFELAAKEMRESFQKSFDACANKWEVGVLIEEFENNPSYEFRDIYNTMHKEQPFMWMGDKIDAQLTFDVSGVQDMSICCYAVGVTGRKIRPFGAWKPGMSTAYNLKIKKDIYIVVDTEATGNTEGLKNYLFSLPRGTGQHRPTLMVIRPVTKARYNQTEVNELIARLGNPRHDTAANLDIIREKKIRATQPIHTKRGKADRLVWEGFPIKKTKYGSDTFDKKFSKKCWSHDDVDLSLGGYYIPIDRWTIQSPNPTYFNEIIRSATLLGLLPSDTKIFGFNQKEEADAIKQGSWTNVINHCVMAFNIVNINNELTGSTAVVDMLDPFGRDFVYHIKSRWDVFSTGVTDGEFKTYIQKLVDMNNIANQYNTNAIDNFLIYTNLSNNHKQILGELREEQTKIWVKYEMISMCDLHRMPVESFHSLIRYINLVESQLTSVE